MMGVLTVRSFEAGDEPAIVELHRQSSRWFEESSLSLDYVRQCSFRPDFRFFVAEYNGKIVGFSGVLFYESVGRAEIGPICTSSDLMNHGVGSLLLEKVFGFLKERGIHRVVARLKSSNVSGISFFQAN